MATIKQALEQADALQISSDSARLDAELLLAFAIDRPREYLFTWPDRELTDAQLDKYDAYCARRATGEPVAYIRGRQAFWSFELKVNPNVLIPRPETELLVDAAIELLDSHEPTGINALDLGTGSGAIALALASHNAGWRVSAVDNSAAALDVARENATSLGLTNIEFIESSWCDGLQENHFDLIAANPPYVERGDSHLLKGSLPFEPISALVAGENGLADIRIIAEQSRRCLKQGAWLLIEHGFEQREAVREILQAAGFEGIECLRDLAGRDRMTSAQACS